MIEEAAMSNVLIASLGDSPIVVTAMYDLLVSQEQLRVDAVKVLCPGGDLIPLGFDFIEDALKNLCAIEKVELPFEDASNEQDCYLFLQVLKPAHRSSK